MGSGLPVYGCVLAGGKSSRMGRDKALLRFRGEPMVSIAVAKLRSFCREVAIVGNRDDLAAYAPIVHEQRMDVGPGAGLEAGLMACEQPWALFLPVDVPLVPAGLLRRWAEAVLERATAGCAASFLLVRGERQPAFCMMRRTIMPVLSAALEGGEHRLSELLYAIEAAGDGWLWTPDVAQFAPLTQTSGREGLVVEFRFSNVNTPQDLTEAEISAAGEDGLA